MQNKVFPEREILPWCDRSNQYGISPRYTVEQKRCLFHQQRHFYAIFSRSGKFCVVGSLVKKQQ
ncbi:MAG: hypothetical protein RM338_03840 [Nostoc sp. DedQUE12a]|nr:hypothetical protein [Nostoc sp. DedQUE12a]